MKRRITFLTLIILSFSSFGQNYKLFNPEKETHFISPANIIYSIRIDSFFVSGADTIFHNHKILTPPVNGNSSCNLILSDTSWIGHKIVSKINGDYLFHTQQNDIILIKSKALLNDSWKLFNYTNGDYIEATITNINQQPILGNIDSVKTITLQAKNNLGTNISNVFNNKTISFSENYGFVETYSFKDFPFNNAKYTLTGFSNPDNGITNLTATEIFDYDVGDEFHTVWKNYENLSYYFWDKREIINVLEKTTSLNQDTLTYVYERCLTIIQNSSSSTWNPDTTYAFDTITSKIILSNYTNLALLTNEPLDSFNYLGSGNGYCQFYFDLNKNKRVKSIYNLYNQDSIDCWTDIIVNGVPYNYTFIEGLGGGFTVGETGYFENYDNGTFSYLPVYYKKGTEVWGTPLDCNPILNGIKNNPLNENQVIVVPNPFTEYATIIVNNYTLFSELTFNLFDVSGKKIRSLIFSKKELILAKKELRSGIYFYQISDENFRFFETGKILVE